MFIEETRGAAFLRRSAVRVRIPTSVSGRTVETGNCVYQAQWRFSATTLTAVFGVYALRRGGSHALRPAPDRRGLLGRSRRSRRSRRGGADSFLSRRSSAPPAQASPQAQSGDTQGQ